jgi:hypothetical protein
MPFFRAKKGFNAESTFLLLQFISMPKREVITKFSKPTATSKILRFQQNGLKRIRLDNDGWVAGSGTDPNGHSATLLLFLGCELVRDCNGKASIFGDGGECAGSIAEHSRTLA